MGGIAKGSGMIHPNMATMLSVITTDANVAPDVWRGIMQRGAANSFNQVYHQLDCHIWIEYKVDHNFISRSWARFSVRGLEASSQLWRHWLVTIRTNKYEPANCLSAIVKCCVVKNVFFVRWGLLVQGWVVSAKASHLLIEVMHLCHDLDVSHNQSTQYSSLRLPQHTIILVPKNLIAWADKFPFVNQFQILNCFSLTPSDILWLNSLARSTLQISVDGDTSTNDTVLGLASGLCGANSITDPNSEEAKQLEAATTALLQVSLQILASKKATQAPLHMASLQSDYIIKENAVNSVLMRAEMQNKIPEDWIL